MAAAPAADPAACPSGSPAAPPAVFLEGLKTCGLSGSGDRGTPQDDVAVRVRAVEDDGLTRRYSTQRVPQLHPHAPVDRLCDRAGAPTMGADLRDAFDRAVRGTACPYRALGLDDADVQVPRGSDPHRAR